MKIFLGSAIMEEILHLQIFPLSHGVCDYHHPFLFRTTCIFDKNIDIAHAFIYVYGVHSARAMHS